MLFYADLHVHSKYSRATSRDLDLENLAYWARKKGIAVVATGDFTHPKWREELKQKLVPAQPGLFRLKEDIEAQVAKQLPSVCHGTTHFMLSVEISTIYKKGDKTRKIHHLIYAADFDAVDRLVKRLDRIGNLNADGRPILGLDSRHLLEAVLESGEDSYLVPAHIWTPWFAALGSKSGFDSIADCYGDLADHIFAVETGLSSDPPMNWRVSSLDRYRLVSNSDAHSPQKLGREACLFNTEIDYFAIRNALESGEGYVGTTEFFPEEGKYHMDGHRNCAVRLSPKETRQRGGLCPVCKQPVTVGVMHRVEDLADREQETPPATAGEVHSLVPLPEILSELEGVGPKSKRVANSYERIVSKLGPELFILEQAPTDEIARQDSPLLAEAISRLRRGEVIREPGFDGQYGVIRLFEKQELKQQSGGLLFDMSAKAAVSSRQTADNPPKPPTTAAVKTATASATVSVASDNQVVQNLDPEQLQAVQTISSPLLILAGPGSGKTRTLTHRTAHLIKEHGVSPQSCLAITFTRRAAEEMQQRLQTLLPKLWQQIPIHTFHSLGLAILTEQHTAAGLQRGFRVSDETERCALLMQHRKLSQRQAQKLLIGISTAKRTGTTIEKLVPYQKLLEQNNLIDFDDLISITLKTLQADPGLVAHYRKRFAWVSVDEYQDMDAQQYQLVQLLAPPDANLCVVGDVDQAIYGFRGADVSFLQRFQQDYPKAKVIRLNRNYRSGRTIVAASDQLISAGGNSKDSLATRTDLSHHITIHRATTEKAEAEFVVHTIEQILGGHSFFSIDSGRAQSEQQTNLSFSDFALLYRINTQAEPLCEALARSGMPFQQRSHNKLSDQPTVQLLLQKLRQQNQTKALWQQLQEMSKELLSEQDKQKSSLTAASIEGALELLKPLATACGDDMARFLSELALGSEIDSWDPQADRISLLTLHAAKGMEFPVVFMLGCEDGLLPLRWNQKDTTDLDEERRLFYVGMTRAKERLFLSWAQKRRLHNQLQPREPSPLLKDIQQQLLQHSRSTSATKRKQNRDDQLSLL